VPGRTADRGTAAFSLEIDAEAPRTPERGPTDASDMIKGFV